jgi:hypothetical protein
MLRKAFRAFVELVVTMIPDSWELPSYFAGDLINMPKRPQPPEEEGPNARVFDLNYTRDRRNGTLYAPEPDWRGIDDIEPYDPSKHIEPAELNSQNNIDALNRAGFDPIDRHAWQRHVLSDDQENLGTHYIYRHPGDALPWHFAPDEDTATIPAKTLRGALSLADQHRNSLRGSLISEAFSHWTKL